MKNKIIPFTILLLTLGSCTEGFEKVDGKWSYISYDEGAGKRITPLEKVDQSTFEIMKDKQYGKDKNTVFINAAKIDNADPKTFSVIGKSYSKDKNHVYFESSTLINADPKTFKVLDFPYSRDNKTVFCGTLPFKVSDIESFKVTQPSTSISTTLTSEFIKREPEYSWIDPIKYKNVVYSEGKAETKNEKFEGFKKK
jgi:hypothetical protein